MKKFTLLAATALMSVAATAQTVVGLERPKTDDGYAAFTSTDAYVKSAEGLTVSFYESTQMAAKRTTTNTATLYRQGVAVQSDFAWTLTCAMAMDDDAWFGANDHPANDKFAEHFTFGYNLNVPEGKRFSVNAVELDLMVSANPTWRVRILNGDEELYNSGNMNKYNGFMNYLSVGNYARITADELSMTYPEDDRNADNAKDKETAALNDGFQLLPADLTLAAGDYTVVLDFDYNTIGFNKALSFDSFTIEGRLASDATEDGTIVIPTTWNFSDWTAERFTETVTKEGLTVMATEGEAVEIDANTKTVDGVKYTQRLKLGGTGTEVSRNLNFKVPGKCRVEVVLMSASGSANRTLNVATGTFDNVVATIDALGASATMGSFDYMTDEPTTIYLYSADSSINVYAIYVTEEQGTVGISNVPHSASAAQGVYNLKGQRVSQPVSGQLYVVGGRKFIAR
ncbi:MAG: hypothetical protein J6M25_02900 [Prevotella sp.]|nr:hypothetical protein [Prevotella sp.]